MRSVQVYVEGQRLELFNDEQITVKSEQQNIADISAVRTDFSQTFTIPASINNNKIFKYFYESAVDSNTDHNIRRSATIEIDLVPFKKGQIQIEKSQLKNGEAESYSVTFYGEVIALKDKFGDELLSDMSELSSESYSYTQANVLAEVQDDTLGAVKFPLVLNRTVSYDTGDADDISHSGSGAIHTDTLFPAVNLLTLFNVMQTRYDLTFSGTFLNDNRFKRAYLHCKNANDFKFITKNKDVPMDNATDDSGNYNTLLTSSDFFNASDDTFNVYYIPLSQSFPNLPSADTYVYGHNITLNIANISDNTQTYYIDVLENGVVTHSISGSDARDVILSKGTSTYNGFNESLNNVFSFRVRATSSITLTLGITYKQEAATITDSPFTFNSYTNIFTSSNSVALSQELDVTQYVPNIKVSDFFKGVLNMFNLTCYGLGDNKYQVEPLDQWYQKGAIVDITKYVDIETIGVDRLPLYKNIDFSYKPSKSITNEAFRDLFSRDFGNTKSSFSYDGGEYKIELPFTNLMFNRFTDTDLQVGFNVDTSLNSYVPEPTIFYMYESVDADFNMNDGSHQALTSYVPFGQDVKYQGGTSSLNFSADYSTLLNEPSQVNLFSSFYYPYLANLYNLKNRNVKLKAVLPVSIITSLQLNDRLIIRDKRYIINSMSSNLTNGEVTLDLIQDFRATLSESGVPVTPIVKPDNSAQCIDIDVLLPKNAISASITGTANITSISPTSITDDSVVTVCIPENVATTGKILTEDSLFNIATEDGTSDVLQEEGTATASEEAYIVTVTYTMYDGSTSSYNQVIIQEP